MIIIGNLTRDPELRTTQSGISVCSFTVAVNRRRGAQDQSQPQADFFRVSAWRQLGENCSKYLAKGRKVAITGPVSVSTYLGNDGLTRAQLEVTADDVEFISPKGEQQPPQNTANAVTGNQYTPPPAQAPGSGFVEVPDDDLPF